MGKAVVVTGALGFIGSRLAQALELGGPRDRGGRAGAGRPGQVHPRAQPAHLADASGGRHAVSLQWDAASLRQSHRAMNAAMRAEWDYLAALPAIPAPNQGEL